MENQNSNPGQKQPLNVFRKAPFLAIAFLYILGFFITQKSKYDSSTTLGIVMLIFGWICMLISMALSVSFLFRLFKEQFKKK
jgi:Ni,Fe-hydrogenase I cytochrome b subunit